MRALTRSSFQRVLGTGVSPSAAWLRPGDRRRARYLTDALGPTFNYLSLALRPLAALTALGFSVAACGLDPSAPSGGAATRARQSANALPDAFLLAGRVTYDRPRPRRQPGTGAVGLDYTAMVVQPARRLVVQALDVATGGAIAESRTTDDGRFTISVPLGQSVRLRVRAELLATAYAPDGVPPDDCVGASFQVEVVDNTRDDALYVLDGAEVYDAAARGIWLHAPLVYQGGHYLDRTAAPFAIADDFVRELEVVCQGLPGPDLPPLRIAWSPSNVALPGDPTTGRVAGTRYRIEGGQSRLYLLGKEDVDTDEFDEHVIAHELGHYFESRLYRADNLGGGHEDGDVLDPTVAFGEGFGDALAGMALADPVYIDTSGAGQAQGFSFDVSVAPAGDDRGIYSETSAGHLLWSLYQRRGAVRGGPSFDRIHEVLRSDQRSAEALTTLETFAAYYNQRYGGDAEDLAVLWSSALGSPYDALCAGSCRGRGDVADPFDADDDLARAYAGGPTGIEARHYPEWTGMSYAPAFWAPYRELRSGLNPPTAHELVRLGGYADPANKLGAVRWYRLAGAGAEETVSLSLPGRTACPPGELSLVVLDRGRTAGHSDGVALQAGTAAGSPGCPAVSFRADRGRTYVVMVAAADEALSGWQIAVTP